MSDSLETCERDLVRLVTLAEAVLSIPRAEVDSIVEQTERYLSALESWRFRFEKQLPGFNDPARLRNEIEKLHRVHSLIVDMATEVKDHVAGLMRDTQYRAQALKAYVDILPSRINLTGTKKG